MAIRILRVIHQDGTPATAKEVWANPHASLFEIAEGPHQGKRGPDYQISSLVGPILWDHSQVSIYETGEFKSVKQ